MFHKMFHRRLIILVKKQRLNKCFTECFTSEVKLASICGISKVIYTLYIDAFPLYRAEKSDVLSGIQVFYKIPTFCFGNFGNHNIQWYRLIRTVYQAFCLYLTHLVLKTVSNIVLLVIVFKSCYGISTFYRRYMMDIIRRNLDFIGKIQLKIRTFSGCLSGITIFDASCL